MKNLARATSLQVIPTVAASLLVLAGALKTYSILTLPVKHNLLLGSVLITTAVIATEFLIGICFFSGRHRFSTMIVLIVMYATFVVLNIYSLHNSEVSCGCFGFLKVHPAIALAVDAVILLFLIGRPSVCEDQKEQKSMIGLSLTFLALVSAISLGYAFHKPPVIVNSKNDVTDTKLIVVDIEQWGKKKVSGTCQGPFMH